MAAAQLESAGQVRISAVHMKKRELPTHFQNDAKNDYNRYEETDKIWLPEQSESKHSSIYCHEVSIIINPVFQIAAKSALTLVERPRDVPQPGL